MRTWPIAVNLVFPTLHYTSCCASGRILIEAISTRPGLSRIWRDNHFEPVFNLEKGLSEISRRCRGREQHKLDLALATAGEVDAVAYVGGLRVTCRDSLNAPRPVSQID